MNTEQMVEVYDYLEDEGKVNIWDFKQELSRRYGIAEYTNEQIERLYTEGIRLRPISHPGTIEQWKLEYCIQGMNETLAYLERETR